jgi:hypothetical protein
MQRRLPVVIWSTLFLTWLCSFVMLVSLVHSKAGMGDGLVEECMRQKMSAEWSRGVQISAR